MVELVHPRSGEECVHKRVHPTGSLPPAGAGSCGALSSRASIASRTRPLRSSALRRQNRGPDPSLSNTRTCATPRTSTGAGARRRRASRFRSSRASMTSFRRTGMRAPGQGARDASRRMRCRARLSSRRARGPRRVRARRSSAPLVSGGTPFARARSSFGDFHRATRRSRVRTARARPRSSSLADRYECIGASIG